MQEDLRHEATYDRLTGLWNRGTIVDHLDREIERAAREDRRLAIAIGDLDHFKAINDRYGHLVGDAVLRQVGSRIASALREYDVVGRYGGEVFLLVLPGCDGAEAMLVADRVRAAVAVSPVQVDTAALAVTLSVGVAEVTAAAGAASGMRRADEALYRAKANGRNRIELSAAPVMP